MNRFSHTRHIAILGIVANIILSAIKFMVGFASRSQAMIADGFNSAQDVFASGITLIGNKIASQPEDRDHPYGHGKAEYIFSMIISFSLVLAGLRILGSSLTAIFDGGDLIFSWRLVAVSIFTIVLKLWLYLYTQKIGRKLNNLLVVANSYDHRNDVFITSAALAGILLGANGYNWVDGVAGVGISGWIILTGLNIFSGAYHVLMDTSIDPDILASARKIIEAIPGVDHVDSIKTKPIGVGYIFIVKVSVDSKLTVGEGHSIAAEVKKRLKQCSYCNVDEVVVHVNPS
ncbi:MAG TPA: cation transporter [Clostridiales bacterium]|nr:cation transporter [Clostridiales bacterium]